MRRLLVNVVLGAALAAALAAATAACGSEKPLVSPTGLWHDFSDQAHGFTLRIQEPFRGAEVGVENGVWTAHISMDGVSRDPRSGVNELTITATRMPAGQSIEPDRLIDVAPSMTAAIVAADRRAGARDFTIEQPLQPLLIGRYHALEMIYTRRDLRDGTLMKSDVLVLVNGSWLLRFTITGDETFWQSAGPAARRFMDKLTLSEPRSD